MDDYSRLVALRCMTCGATYAFETDKKTGKKCNRVYRGGEDELVHLNMTLIEDEKEQLIDEVKN